MQILVTGGAGFIGSHLVRELVHKTDLQVTVLDNLYRGSREALQDVLPHIRFVEADLRDRAAVDAIMPGIQAVFHLAAQSNVIGAAQDPAYCFDTNAAGTFHLLQSAKKHGVERFIFTSSREIYGDAASLPVDESAPFNPKNAYGASKASGEHYCRVAGGEGLNTTVLRLANVYGPGDRDRVIPIFLDNALHNGPLVVYGEEKVVDFIWVGDVVAVLLQCLSIQTSGPVNVCSGAGTTISSLARRIVELTGSDSPVTVHATRGVEVDRFVGSPREPGRCLDWPQTQIPSICWPSA
jgi:UDP-glucose 4-epimerase